jgi:hypothetical protein
MITSWVVFANGRFFELSQYSLTFGLVMGDFNLCDKFSLMIFHF